MYTETINKCAANAARINRFERSDKLGFWLSSAMAGAYVGLGIILIFTLGNLVDPAIRPDLAQALVEVLMRPELAADLRQRGVDRARQFTWQRTAEQTLRAYESLD